MTKRGEEGIIINKREAFKAAIDGKEVRKIDWADDIRLYLKGNAFYVKNGNWLDEILLVDYADDSEWEIYSPPKFKKRDLVTFGAAELYGRIVNTYDKKYYIERCKGGPLHLVEESEINEIE